MPEAFDRSGRLSVRFADLDDVEKLAPDLRPADLIELGATGVTPREALTGPFLRGHAGLTLTFELDGEPVGMGGLCPLAIGVASIWLLGTRRLTEDRRAFLVLTRRLARAALGEFPFVTNVFHADRAETEAWLRKIGFDIGDAILHLSGVRLKQFSLRRRQRPET